MRRSRRRRRRIYLHSRQEMVSCALSLYMSNRQKAKREEEVDSLLLPLRQMRPAIKSVTFIPINCSHSSSLMRTNCKAKNYSVSSRCPQ